MITYRGGNGLTKEESIIILGAKDETEGVDAEYIWLEQKYGRAEVDWEMIDQTLLDGGDSQFDILKIKFSYGKMEEFWFEIDDFYGR
jgi:hypothetical protein